MKLLELINDRTLVGFGFLTIERPFSSRSLIAVFYQREEKQIWLDVFWVNIKISIG